MSESLMKQMERAWAEDRGVPGVGYVGVFGQTDETGEAETLDYVDATSLDAKCMLNLMASVTYRLQVTARGLMRSISEDLDMPYADVLRVYQEALRAAPDAHKGSVDLLNPDR